MDMGDTWYYWFPGDFSMGNPDWPASLQFMMTRTGEQSRSGNYSLRIEQLDPNASEAVAISERVPVTPGEPVLVSYWLKYEDVPDPETIGTGENNIGMTALWYSSLESGAAGYNEINGVDIRLNGEYNTQVIPMAPRVESSGWTQYAFVVYPNENAVGMEVRLRYFNGFAGVTYWDDVSIVRLGGLNIGGTVVSIDDRETIERAVKIHLEQNYPNPFNPTTKIGFELPNADVVTLEVYNMLGQKVAELLKNTMMGSGRHTVEFNASGLPSGVYLYRLNTNTFSESRKMMLIK
ncbi:MAG: T9SS C-terminal target domain-containing protein [Balneolaceae bacterium]|nr:MAG: T9SS C-terminal target domain-containing protein [Balneolaceae bacterium]